MLYSCAYVSPCLSLPLSRSLSDFVTVCFGLSPLSLFMSLSQIACLRICLSMTPPTLTVSLRPAWRCLPPSGSLCLSPLCPRPLSLLSPCLSPLTPSLSFLPAPLNPRMSEAYVMKIVVSDNSISF